MRKIFKISSAFVGIIVGAGFASGQELLQYFTSFGYMGTIGAFVAIVLFGYLGMILTKLGSRTRAESHQEVIHKISGRFLGVIIDYILVFILLGIGIVMIAGSGSIFHQHFGLPSIVGTILMVVLVILTLMLKVDGVIKVIGNITPFLIIVVIYLFIHSMFTMDASFADLEPIAQEQTSAAGHWLISLLNYVSFNIATGASMTLVMGGDERNEKIASIGGLVGGIAIGLIMTIGHLSIFSKVDSVGDLEMPLLGIANSVSPIFGLLYAIVLFGMIFNTAVSMFFSFGIRFAKSQSTKFKVIVISAVMIGFAASFFGFVKLVSFFYPLFGYLGMLLIIVLIITSFRMKKIEKVKK
nr:hypothetical protein [Oceanobacillus rekensis]